MPPKVRITKESKINTALELVRTGGMETINARGIAAALGCSTQPIFSNFSSIEELEAKTIEAAYSLYLGFTESEAKSGKYPTYKAYGMAYIRFANEERELFKLLFMRDRQGEDMSPTSDFEASCRLIMEANGISKEKAMLMHLEMWSCVHGIATMLATSFLTLEWELISNMISDVYHGIRAKHIEEEKNGSDKN